MTQGWSAGNDDEVGYYWWGDSLLSGHNMLDDLFQYVAEVEPTLPNPFEVSVSEIEATPEVTAIP